MRLDPREVLRYVAKQANGGVMPPDKPARKKPGTGEFSQRKRRKLAEYRGIDTPEFWDSLEGKFLTRWRAAGGPEPERQYVFAPPRRYRADFAFPAVKVLIEVDGGTWIESGHSTGKGHRRDREKANLATILGWAVLRWTSDMVADELGIAEAVEMVKQRMKGSVT